MGIISSANTALIFLLRGSYDPVTPNFQALSPHADAVSVLVGAAGPIVDHPLHVHNVPRFLGFAIQVAPFLGINMLIGQPVVLRVLVLKVRIPLPALLLSEILKVLGAILSVAELELIARPYARAASVGWMRVVTLPCSVLHPRATGARAGAKLTPCPPVPVLFQDVWCQPDAVAFKAVLSWCTHGPVQRRPFLCFAEVGVLRVATPQLLTGIKRTKSCAHHVAQTKIKTALLIHGVVNSWQLWKGRPVMFEGIIAQTIIGMEVSIQLLLAAAGPVEAVEGSLHKGGHDAPQADLIPTSVSLAVMLHA